MAIIEPFTQLPFESVFDWHNIKIEYTFRNRLKTTLEMGPKWVHEIDETMILLLQITGVSLAYMKVTNSLPQNDLQKKYVVKVKVLI